MVIPIGMFMGPMPGMSIMGFIPTLGPIILALELWFIIAFAPVMTIVRNSGGRVVRWSSVIAAKLRTLVLRTLARSPKSRRL